MEKQQNYDTHAAGCYICLLWWKDSERSFTNLAVLSVQFSSTEPQRLTLDD